MIIDFPHQIQPLKALWKQAFGDTDAFIDGFFRTGFNPWRCRCVYVEDKPVSVVYWFDCLWQNKPVAYLYAIATDKAYRGQGLFRQLLQNTHEYLADCGYVGAVLVPAEKDLFAMYEKLGYQNFSGKEQITLPAQPHKISVLPLSAKDYLQKRAAFLPAGSVCHRETAMEFAATYTSFYTAENCLFCAAKEQDTLYFQEFFGNRELLPGLIWELGAEKGIVPLPGDAPFALYHSLDGSNDLPAYFTMALD